MGKLQKVVIFIPAYNEESDIGEVIRKTRELYSDSDRQGFEAEILVVNDGSSDATAEKAQKAGADKVVSHVVNRGLGAATRTAMHTAYDMGADVAIKLDADLQHDPADIAACVKPLLEGHSDICWGYRVMKYDRTLVRTLGNTVFTWLMNRLTQYKITDAQTGMMAFNRHYLSQFEILGNYNPPQQLLIDAWQKHMEYTEVPTSFHSRKNGDSFVSLKYPFKVLLNIARIMVYGNPFKSFLLVGFVLFLLSIFLLGLSFILFVSSSSSESVLFSLYLGTLFLLIGVHSVFFAFITDYIRVTVRAFERRLERPGDENQ